MRIVIVSHYLLPHYGGIEVTVDQEADHFTGQGHEVVLVGSNIGADVPHVSSPTVKNATIHRIPAWNGLERRWKIPLPVFSPLRLITVLWHAIREADIVHAYGYLQFSTLVALVIARLQKKPAILTEYPGEVWYSDAWKRVAQKLAIQTIGRANARLATGIITSIAPTEKLLRRLTRSKVPFIYLPFSIDSNFFTAPTPAQKREARHRLGWHDHRPKVLFVGRLIENKGIDLLIAAHEDSYDLVICGRIDGNASQWLKGKHVVYFEAPSKRELRDIYYAADILALPSRSEGALPLVVQEALLCNLPVVITRFPGAERFYGCAGLTFCSPSIESIRSIIGQVLEKSGKIAVDGEKAIQEFFLSPQQWVERFLSFTRQTPPMNASNA